VSEPQRVGVATGSSDSSTDNAPSSAQRTSENSLVRTSRDWDHASSSSSKQRATDASPRITDSGPPAIPTGRDSDLIPALARRTIETFIADGTIVDLPDNLSDLLSARA